MKKVFIIIILLFLISCTDNNRARNFGGKIEVKLPPGKKLIIATWKEAQLWYLTEDMPADYIPSNKEFHEDSQFGIWQGTVVFIESK